MIELLRANVTYVNKRVYPPDEREDATMPRVTVDAITPSDTPLGLGEGLGSYKGVWLLYTFNINIWDKDPGQIKTVADQVIYCIWKNRSYVPASPRDAHGEFTLLTISGGSPTTENVGKQLYQRTINVTGRWLSKSVETW